jgi:hypothetical protein
VDQALARIWKLKQRAFEELSRPEKRIAQSPAPAAEALAKQISREAISIVETTARSPLPFKHERPIAAILLKPFETAIEPPEQPLGMLLRQSFRDAHYIQLGPKADQASYRRALEMASALQQLLIAIIVRPAAWHAFGLKSEQRAFVNEILMKRRDAVLACLGVPSALDEFEQAAIRICTYSDVPASQEALVDFLIRSS